MLMGVGKMQRIFRRQPRNHLQFFAVIPFRGNGNQWEAIVVNRGWLAFMWAVIGAVVGQLLGTALARQVPFLQANIPLSMGPGTLDLAFMNITLGISLKLSIAGAVGLVLALWLALRN